MTIAEARRLWDSWIIAMEAQRLSRNTVENYSIGARQLLDWIEARGEDVDLAAPGQARAWLAELAATRKGSTLQVKLGAVRAFAAFLAAEDEEFAVLEACGAGVGGLEVAVHGADVPRQGGFVFGELGADPLEAGEGVDALHAEPCGDGVLHRAGDKGFQEDGPLLVRVVQDA